MAIATAPPRTSGARERTATELVRLVFDGDYERVHADVRAALFDPLFDPRAGLTMDEAGRLAYERSRFLHARLGRPSAVVADPPRLFALAEWPSVLDVSVFSLLMVHYNLTFGTVHDHGAGRTDLADLVGDLDSLAAFGPYMATELGYGNNVAALRTEAAYDRENGTFTLNTPGPLAQKYMSYSGFTDVPKVAVVLARLRADGRDHGVYPFLVRIADENGLRPGVHAAPCPEKPVQGLDNGVTWFDNVRLPRRSLLLGDMGEFAEDGAFRPLGGNARQRFLRSMTRIQPGRLCVSSSAVGAGRASVYIALRYARQRLVNGPGRKEMPVIEYRSHQLAVFTAMSTVYAMSFLLNRGKRAYLAAGGAVDADLNGLIAVTKALSTWQLTDVVTSMRERCGAQGMFSVNRIADYVSLLQGLVTAEGDNKVLLATVAAQLLAAEETEPPPPAPDGSAHDIGDPALHQALLGYRERALRESARSAMHDDTVERTYLEAWNGTMNAALAMARTRGVRLAVEEFHAAVARAEDSDAATGLRLLATLYALTEIHRDAGWYLARGVLTAAQVERLPATLDELCPRILPLADALADGFALTPELVRAPIAAEDYVTAFQSLTDARPER
ncbi:acyl-CoA dehydrogenase family protein [Actinophytocola xanthii]|uniref:Acyl-CoA oxidase n=1 Tax=Actinophytocola xanthii TaxID=1912961 RepID=A0A1Q8CDR5_9PSEU|nr:acyl-CoA dehydrogenase [Actinophytocola xanthii]OLF12511.1 acyl-CoA oxidase [Actinophytocola xanthii]